MEDRYIGPNKIVGAVELEMKTPAGQDVVKITYENSDLKPELLPKSVFERIVQKEPMDYTSFREFRYKPFLEKLTLAFLEENVVYEDTSYLLRELANKLNAAVDRASVFLWTGKDGFVPGVDVMNGITFLDIESVLKKINKSDADEPKGGESN